MSGRSLHDAGGPDVLQCAGHEGERRGQLCERLDGRPELPPDSANLFEAIDDGSGALDLAIRCLVRNEG